MSLPRTALIVGASRGLGLLLSAELARRGWSVLATVRAPSAELDKVISRSQGRVQALRADMTDAASLRRLQEQLASTRLDLLFVNAAVNRSFGSIAEATTEEFVDVLTTNALAPLRVLEAVRNSVVAGGTVAVMSSEQGSISRNEEDGFEVYKASKAALNQLMRSYANRHPDDGHAKLLVDPGHNRTSLGGDDAPFDPAESMSLVADVIETFRPDGNISFLDRYGNVVPW